MSEWLGGAYERLVLDRLKLSLHRSVLLVVGASLVAALLPAGIVLDRRLESELREKARDDLAVAPVLLADRNRTAAYALAVRAKDLATNPYLRQAVIEGRIGSARRIAEAERDSLIAEVILVGPDGEQWAGPPVGDTLARSALSGGLVVAYRRTEDGLRRVALAPIPAPADPDSAGRERGPVAAPGGAAGITLEVGAAHAGALAGLTRSEVLILDLEGSLVAASGDSLLAADLARGARQVPSDGDVHSAVAAGRRWLVSAAPLDAAGRVVFARPAAEELAVLPELRRGGAFAVMFALAVALVLAGIFARTLVVPVEGLARAADRLASGDGDAPIERSRIHEVDRVGQAFSDMRRALAGKMRELEQANRELATRQSRLKILQAEMIRRDRLAASGRLVAELAHEIRNPVASVRNCLELVRRKLGEQDREFADLAIDELLRMHELAEQMLDLNRPSADGDLASEPVGVAEKISELIRASAGADDLRVDLRDLTDRTAEATLPQDALKQILLNLVENAREAMPKGGVVEIVVSADDAVVTIDVRDRGSGIPPDVLPSIFDPFFTTKGGVRGVGLGLFIAEGIVRRHGGSISATNRDDGRGAVFRIELPRARRTEPDAGADEAVSA